MWSKIVFSVWLLIIQNALADVEEPETLDVDELISKCKRGDLAGVTQLAAKFGNTKVIWARDDQCWTCLKAASSFGDFHDLVSFLLKIDANPNVKCDLVHGHLPLTLASRTRRLSNVKLLLAHGADAKAEYSQALYELSYYRLYGVENQKEIARLLLQHCANPDADKPGRGTPFMMAVETASIGVIREMAIWMKEVPKIEREDVAEMYRDQFNDVEQAIEEGKNFRELVLDLFTQVTAEGQCGGENACSPLTSSIA